MALFIKPGYWLAAPYKPKYWLNLTDLVSTVVTPLLNDNPIIEALTYPVENSYADNTALFADQGNQTVRYFQYVIGTDTYYEKLVTSTGAIVDYRELTADEVTTIILQGNSKRPVNKIYANAAAMYADQKKQITGFLYRTSDDDAHFEYLGTKNGNATDYKSVGSAPSLQAVTDVGNTTTLNIAALSFNDLSLFAQIGVDIHNIGIGVEALANGNTGTNVVGIGFRALYGNSGGDQTAVGHLAMSNTSGGSGNTGIGYGTFQSNSGTASTALGKYAGRNNTGDSGTFIGYQAGNDNTGIYVTAVGHSAGDNNTAGQSTLIGYTAGFSNVGADSSLLGYGAGYANSGARATGIGEFALRNNSGADVTAIGYSAGFENQGLDVTAIGSQSLEFNPSDLVTAVGKNSGRYNAESSVVVIGDNAGVYNGGTNVVALGSNTISFTDDTGNAQNVANAGIDINTSTETITITAHGFGANGTYVNLKYSTTGTPIGGLVAGEVYQFLIVDANNIQSTANLSSVGTDTHTFTPQFVYNNVTVLGANAEPTKSNQVTLGDSSVTEVYTDGHIKTHREVKDDTTTAYELVLADRNSVVTMNNAGANTLTIPANASVAFSIGTKIVLINKGAGTTTVAITTDTLNQNVGGLTLAQYDKRTLTKITATEWILGY